jgi:hypothetical protein
MVGCGALEPRPETAITDEQVNEYYQEFVQMCHDTNHTKCLTNIPKLKSIQIVDAATLAKHSKPVGGDPQYKKVGLCTYRYHTSKPNAIADSNVYLLNNNGYGENWFPEELRALLFHELGHCLLQLDHPNPTRPPTNPAIMNHRMYPHQTYIDNWDTMVAELFTN